MIFRITHRDNLAHLLQNGVHCRNSSIVNPAYVVIGHEGIIGMREQRSVPVGPMGVIGDYVPFYFTPRSPMLHNILTGRNGVTIRQATEIVVMVSSLDRLDERRINFVIADRNASLAHAMFRPGRELVPDLPWPDLQQSDYRRDLNRPDKIERYMAEALVHGYLPTDALLGIITHDRQAQALAEQAVSDAGVAVKIHVSASWYP